jgi:hypothetical protein
MTEGRKYHAEMSNGITIIHSFMKIDQSVHIMLLRFKVLMVASVKSEVLAASIIRAVTDRPDDGSSKHL